MRVGLLGLQGAYAAHGPVLRALGHEPVEVRTAEEIRAVDGLVLPGGESTAQLRLIEADDLEPALHAHVAADKPVLGVCAGLVLAATNVVPPQKCLGWLDATVKRNGFGSQRHSFEGRADSGLPLLMIRGPRITEVGDGVEVVERLDGEPIMVKQGSVVCTSFHPELTDSLEVHRRVFARRQR